jgi:hypothetical protein
MLHLQYDVIHKPHILALNKHEGVLGVDCFFSGRMRIHLNGTDSSFEDIITLVKTGNALISGGREWRCSFTKPQVPSTIMRRITQMIHIESNADSSSVVVDLSTEQCQIHDFFESGTSSFVTSIYHRRLPKKTTTAQQPSSLFAMKVTTSSTPLSANMRVAQTGWFSDICDDAWAAIVDLADVVEDIVNIIVNIVKAFTGNLDGDDDIELGSLSTWLRFLSLSGE